MGFKIGITFRDDVEQEHALFSNGISQNLKFLYDVLEEIGCEVFFLLGSAPKKENFIFNGKQYRAKQVSKVISNRKKIDVVLEGGVSVNQNERENFRQQCGAKIVSVKLGCVMIMDMEQLFLSTTMTPGIHINRPDRVWTTPHLAYGASYLETLYDSSVSVCPYLWEPDFVSQPFESAVVEQKKDIYVMEPNISVLKNALLPMAIIEKLYRSDAESFGKATILNGLEYNSEPYFLHNIVENMSSLLAEASKVYFTGRYKFDEAFQKPDVLLGHQWGCELNYLYCEALHRGVPLVHNSKMMKEVGYYYPDFEVGLGAEACMQALAATDIESEVEKNHKWLHRFSIHNKSVQNTYRELIAEVINS